MKGLLLFTAATVAGIAWAAAGGVIGEEVPPCSLAAGGVRRPYQPETAVGCGGMSYAEWLRFDPVKDHRPWWQRLRASLFGEVGIDKAKLRIDRGEARLSGAYRDGDKPKPEVNALAGGLKVEGTF